MIKAIMANTSLRLSKDATLSRAGGHTAGAGGVITQGYTDTPIKAHWTSYTDKLRRAGVPESDRYAHMPEQGVKPSIEDILTIGSDKMTIEAVKRGPEGGVWYLAGK